MCCMQDISCRPLHLYFFSWDTTKHHPSLPSRSIVMHQGGLERGHYYTYVRRKRQDNDIRWFKLDDNRVSSVEESEVSLVRGAVTASPATRGSINGSPYILSFFHCKALEDAFGHGERKWGGLTCLRGILRPRDIVGRQSRASPFRSDCNAYILQYHLNR